MYTYSDIFTFYSDIFRYIVTYLEFSVALAYSELCHIQNPGIFRASVKTYSSIFRTLCKTRILRTLP